MIPNLDAVRFPDSISRTSLLKHCLPDAAKALALAAVLAVVATQSLGTRWPARLVVAAGAGIAVGVLILVLNLRLHNYGVISVTDESVSFGRRPFRRLVIPRVQIASVGVTLNGETYVQSASGYWRLAIPCSSGQWFDDLARHLDVPYFVAHPIAEGTIRQERELSVELTGELSDVRPESIELLFDAGPSYVFDSAVERVDSVDARVTFRLRSRPARPDYLMLEIHRLR